MQTILLGRNGQSFSGKSPGSSATHGVLGLLPEVHRLYFEPEYQEFASRTMWSLSNAFTSAFKKLDPLPQFKATAKLGEFLTQLPA
jgi:hypothetical protein